MKTVVVRALGALATSVAFSGVAWAQAFSTPPSKPPATPEVSSSMSQSFLMLKAKGIYERGKRDAYGEGRVDSESTGNIYFFGRTPGDLLVLPSLKRKEKP